jgi:hypothetical protein
MKLNPRASAFLPPDPVKELIKINTIIPFHSPEASQADAISYRVVNGFVYSNRWLSLEEFKSIPSGYGGRVGVLPYFVEDGQTYYLLNISNRGLNSDFGGGLKAKMTPYHGLIKELKEEAPQWADLYLHKLEDLSDPPVIYSEEKMLTNTNELRTNIMILLHIDKPDINEFVPTKEVTQLKVVNEQEFQYVLYHEPVNNGLLLIRPIFS